jgi:hypothetical protein
MDSVIAGSLVHKESLTGCFKFPGPPDRTGDAGRLAFQVADKAVNRVDEWARAPLGPDR